MATILLAGLGAAVGASVGGGVLGLSSVVIGRAVGATLGRVIDQRLLGAGSAPVERGRVERFRLTGASEGPPVTRLYGRMRIGGQVIWASAFRETVQRTGGGKGIGGGARVNEHSYSVSLAIALCDGEISGVGRVWADGQEMATSSLNMTVYPGSEEQLPDPVMEAVEGAGAVPAYRGTAYVVMEELDLTPFGSRVPMFSFEVFRPAPPLAGVVDDPARAVRAVALIPGTGEYALATTPVHLDLGAGEVQAVNVTTAAGEADLVVSLDALANELPRARAVSVVVCWFGDDLRAGECSVRPRAERTHLDGTPMAWSVAGLDRVAAGTVPLAEGRPIYGGTPADAAVVEAIREMAQRGLDVMFYPFLLMEQMAGNLLPDPWTGEDGQPALPWRGRITTSLAPGVAGSPDGTAAAADEVAAFFGTCAPGDFAIVGDTVVYSGPEEFGWRRFILHYAHLCAAAGGVDAFCVGSELRGVTQIRGEGGGFPAVEALRQLAAEVKAILPGAKVGYAADWTEYFGYQPQDGSGDVLFHLDPLWTDENVDFVGIDNYMPLADWRDGEDHADAHWGSVHDLGYLTTNVTGGEGYDWYYHAPEAREAQLRTPITDGAYGDDWIFRVKDIRGWWSNPHHDRIGGVRQEADTGWVPGMKPVWFTELGCAAVDKGANEPNKFLDPKSSESALPWYSNGRRDDVMQMQYLRAMHGYWNDPGNNPLSAEYGGAMVDMARAFVWAWDARPFPAFPGRGDRWADGANYSRGHWLNGRGSARSLASVVAEVAGEAGVTDYDVLQLHGLVRGYSAGGTETARAVLQPLMLGFGFAAAEREGVLRFHSRGRAPATLLGLEALVAREAGDLELSRAPEAEVVGRLRLSYTDAEGDYEVRTAEAVFPDDAARTSAHSELPLALVAVEGRGIAERWLAEARVARDTARFALPPSRLGLGAGDVVELPGEGGAETYRIDRVEHAGALAMEAVRTEAETYTPSDTVQEAVRNRPFVTPVPVFPLFLDLPLLTGSEVPHAPHLAVTARPWPGSAAVFSAASDEGYALNTVMPDPAVLGVLEQPLAAGPVGRIDRGGVLRVRLTAGELASVTLLEMLNGANAAAVGDGSSDLWEVIQFQAATLMGPRVWELTGLLRGQAGGDAVMPEVWPAGSYFVRLDGAVRQIGMDLAARRLARHYRIGPGLRPPEDPSYRHLVAAFDGIGLRPYAPVHLRERIEAGDRYYSWVRRTRIGGDSWEFEEVPLGEAFERYRVRVMQGATQGGGGRGPGLDVWRGGNRNRWGCGGSTGDRGPDLGHLRCRARARACHSLLSDAGGECPPSPLSICSPCPRCGIKGVQSRGSAAWKAASNLPSSTRSGRRSARRPRQRWRASRCWAG